MRAAFMALILFGTAPALAAEKLAPGTFLVPGGLVKDRQPDGNSVVWQGPDGLVVLDTGRHAGHSAAIIALAEELHAPVAAILNSHWHLDHVSGNLRLKARWPQAKVYASGAIDGALTGFLAKNAVSSKALLAEGKLPPETLDDIRLDLDTISHGAALKPDVVIDHSQTLRLAGKALRLNLAQGATAGDLWVYDPDGRVAAAGDLVTLPVPFLDTADPKAWSKALGGIAATGFIKLVPGHGRVLTRAEFARYRTAFDALLVCAASPADAKACGDAWMTAVTPLLSPGEEARGRAMIGYYVNLLRKSD